MTRAEKEYLAIHLHREGRWWWWYNLGALIIALLLACAGIVPGVVGVLIIVGSIGFGLANVCRIFANVFSVDLDIDEEQLELTNHQRTKSR